MAKAVIDTHTWLWFLDGDKRIGANARAILDDPTSELVIPMMVLAEACWMVEHGRTSLTVEQIMQVADEDPRVVIVPFDRMILDRTLGLCGIREMHDRQIVATALTLADDGEAVTLLTRDQQISASGLVSVVW